MPLSNFFRWAKPQRHLSEDIEQELAIAGTRGTPLTPREIEELHAKLYPETHEGYTFRPKEVLRDPRQSQPDLSRTYKQILEGFTARGNGQRKSSLFSRLPKELRLEIWKYALGEHRIILRIENSNRLINAHWHSRFSAFRNDNLLNVLLLAKAAYLEASTILYSSNIFCIGFGADANYQPLTLLHDLLPQRCINHIRHVELGWHTCYGTSQYYDSHPQAWDLSLLAAEPVQITSRLWRDVCETLARLPSLRVLRIMVWASGDQREKLVDHDEGFLMPLEPLKKVQEFRVTISWGRHGSIVWQEGQSYIARKYRMDTVHEVNIPILDYDTAGLQL